MASFFNLMDVDITLERLKFIKCWNYANKLHPAVSFLSGNVAPGTGLIIQMLEGLHWALWHCYWEA